MGKTFKKIVLCSTNDFPQNKNDKIKGWVEHHGGVYTTELTSNVTHLLASENAWKGYHPIVKEARRRRGIKIVNFDWLEDSLLSKSRRPLDTSGYDFEQKFVMKHRLRLNAQKAIDALPKHGENGKHQKKPEKAACDAKVEQAGRAFDRSCLDFEETMRQAGYHPYTNDSDFEYSITYMRKDIFDNMEQDHLSAHHEPLPCAKNSSSTKFYRMPLSCPFSFCRVVLDQPPRILRPGNPQIRVPIRNPYAQCVQLYQSDSTPYTYACHILWSKQEEPGKAELAPTGSTWELAMDTFKMFFKQRTGCEWDDHIEADH